LDKVLTVPHQKIGGRLQALCSKETYIIVNQPTKTAPGEPARRRFVQVRGIDVPEVAGRVHALELHPGGRWFRDAGVTGGDRADSTLIEAVVGEGVARELAKDKRVERAAGSSQGTQVEAVDDSLGVGDRFSLGDREWIIVGILQSEGTTFGS